MSNLHQAAKAGNMTVVKKLVQRGTPIDSADDEKWTPLHYAVIGNFSDLVSFLVISGANVNAKSADGLAPIHCAIKNDNDLILTKLVEGGADVNIQDADGLTPLHYAAYAKSSQCLIFLIEFGAKVNVFSNNHYTPLHIAVECQNIETIKILIDVGASVNAIRDAKRFALSSVFWAPLHIAVQNANVEIINILIDASADVNIANKQGATPLHIASQYNRPEIVKLLIDNNANIEATDVDGDTPLLISIRSHQISNFEYLCNKNNLESLSNKEGTALHIACRYGFIDIVSKIIDVHNDVSFINKPNNITGNTPLHEAVISGNAELVQLLLDNGADPTIRNNKLLGDGTPDIQAGQSAFVMSTGKITEVIRSFMDKKREEGEQIVSPVPRKYGSKKSGIPIRSPKKATPKNTNGDTASETGIYNLEDAQDYVAVSIENVRKNVDKRISETRNLLQMIKEDFDIKEQ
jgi:ankyrin repeat protein